jgi:VanZ family protein
VNRLEAQSRTLPFWAIFVLSLVSFLTPGSDLPETPGISDKVEHAAIFALLALAGCLAGYKYARLLAGLLAYAITSEVLQAVLPIQRDGDWRDVLADVSGLVAALLLVGGARRLRG